MSKQYKFLPADSIAFLESLNNEALSKINCSIAQNRIYCEFTEIKKNKKEDKQCQPLLMEFLKKENKPIESNNFFSEQMKLLLEKLLQRNWDLARNFSCQEDYLIHIPGRIFLGEEGVSPYKTILLLKLHPLYGVPYLPASTIKGALRHCFKEYQAENPEIEKDLLGLETELFGSEDPEAQAIGKLIFFDAFPQKFSFCLDIQTPHYPEYYRGELNRQTIKK